MNENFILRRWLAKIGQWVLGWWQVIVHLSSVGVAVIWQTCRLITWRRTIWAEFIEQCYQTGIRTLPLILFGGIIVGFGIVFQAVYWLEVFGQSEFTGQFLAIVLVGEIAPILVGLIMIGRSGSVIMVELGNMKAGGQIHMLDAQGIDPFLYLLIPRVLAVSLSTFSLTVIFLMVALGAGLFLGNMMDISTLSIFNFLFKALGPTEYVMFLLKTFLIGFVIALICCTTALTITGSVTDLQEMLPRGFVQSVLAMFIISALVTLLL